MKNFDYTVLDYMGKRSQGTIEGTDRAEVYEELRSRGMIIIGLKEETKFNLGDLGRNLGRCKEPKKSQFYRQGAIMMKAGVPIGEVVRIMEGENRNGGGLKEKLAGGMSLASAMTACGKKFSSQEIAMVEAGEYGGNLEWVFSALADNFQRREKLEKGFRMAMLYPSFLVILSLCSLLFIVLGVLPVILDVFGDLSLDLPWPTRFLMEVSHASWKAAVITVVVPILLVIGIITARSRQGIGSYGDRLMLRMPFWGRLWLMKDMSLLLGTLSMLLESGIVIDKAMGSCAVLCSNLYLREDVQEMSRRLARGNGLTTCMNGELYPEIIRGMVSAGEASGELPVMLRHGSELCLEESENKIQVIETMAEPVIVAGLGIIIGFIVISIVWPMLELMTAYL